MDRFLLCKKECGKVKWGIGWEEKKDRAPLYIFVLHLQRNGDLDVHKVQRVRDSCSDNEEQRTWESLIFFV